MTKIFYKNLQFVLAFLTIFVLSASFYFQYFLGLQPCPLCLMQRLCVFFLLVIILNSIFWYRQAHGLSMFQILFSVAGMYFSLRQVWLQSLPVEKAPACMPTLDILIHYFPWQSIARALLWGAGDCAEASWSFWGISMAGWCFAYFLFILCSGLWVYMKTLNQP